MSDFRLAPPPEAPGPRVWTDAEKSRALRDVLKTWDRGELRDVITDSFFDEESMINMIMENGLLDDEIDEILIEAGKMEAPPVLCGGTTDPKEERALYDAAMTSASA